ncbi:MAG: hypothetical protein ABIK09_11960 [Pseudomonadota bacterium]
MSWLLPVLAAAGLLLAPDHAAGSEEYFIIGPSMGMVHGPGIGSAAVATVDASFGLHLEDEHSWLRPPKYSMLFWASGGARLWVRDQVTAIPYVEAGMFVYLNVGGGYGYLLGGDHPARHTAHLFVGAPLMPALAFWGMKWKGLLIEPYYRPTWTLGEGGGDTFHEWGILVKYVFGEI